MVTGILRRMVTLIGLAGILVSCSTAPATGPIAATLKEWQISLSSTTHAAGAVTFNITNAGDKEHEFIVRKTDLKADSLPLIDSGEDAGRVSEDAPELTAVGDPSEVAEIASGSTDRTLTVTLQPGHYVIFCNLHVEDLLHYQKGMRVDLTIQ